MAVDRVPGAHMWEIPLWEPEDETEREEIAQEQAHYVAWCIACLWWVAHEGSEIAPTLNYTRDELAAWLEARNEAESRIVRAQTRSGNDALQMTMWAVR